MGQKWAKNDKNRPKQPFNGQKSFKWPKNGQNYKKTAKIDFKNSKKWTKTPKKWTKNG
jgi:hypothetical protein